MKIIIYALLFFCVVVVVFYIQEQKDVQGVDSHGVVAYINRISENEKYNYYNGHVTGLKWQCVEYARRWLMCIKDVTFTSVENASDIWNISNVTSLSNPSNRYEFVKEHIPTVGSLVIYRKTTKFQYGHVAVIVAVHENGEIDIAEQNQSVEKWKHKYSRRIRLEHEPDVIGCKTVKTVKL